MFRTAHSYDDDDYIRIFNGGGCASMLGRQGGRQHLTLGNGCHSMATIMHEFTHALGIGHTQAWDPYAFSSVGFEWFIDPF